MNKQELLDFEENIFDEYSAGKIKGTIHLSGSKDGYLEYFLISLFKKIKSNDWVFSTHRNHYHCLLKSNNPEWVKSEIMKGNSMHINSEKHKIFTSSIVGGTIPIALGVALSIKKKKQKGHVYCFIGDMASQMGQFYEAVDYAQGHKLPITFIIENNELGVYTPTKKVWGNAGMTYGPVNNIIRYKYERKYPHHGSGKWVHF